MTPSFSVSTNINLKPKSLNSTNNTTRKHPEATLKCIETTPANEKSLEIKNDSKIKKHRKCNTNTQFIEDMKSNISMQFERLKEFKETRTIFQKVLEETGLESTNKSSKPSNNYDKYQKIDDFSYHQSQSTLRKDYNQSKYNDNELPTHKKPYDINEKSKKSISCHYNKNLLNNNEDSDYNEKQMSNKFSCNRTSNILYGQMKITEKKTQIDSKILSLRELMNKTRKGDNNLQIKDLYSMFEDLNECYQGLFII